MKDLTPVEVAWVAGLLEGEGCFTLAWSSVQGGIYPRVGAQCRMTDEDVIWRLYKLCGGNVRGPIKRENPKHKDIWQWNLGRKSGLENFLKILLPYMSNRRSTKIEEILNALSCYPARSGWQHGTRWGYEKGCRCKECRAAHAKRQRNLRKRRRGPKAPRMPKHGTRNEYERHGCRCDACKAQNAERSRSYYRNKV